MSSKSLEELAPEMAELDWLELSEKEREEFSKAMVTLQTAMIAHSKIESIVSSRKNLLFGVFAIVGGMTLFGGEPLSILIVSLVVQLAFFGYSQIIEFGSQKILDRSRANLEGIVRRLSRPRG